MSYSYQWQRCDANGGNCADIPGATGQTYVLTNADLADTIRVRVTDGVTTATSPPTAVIGSPPPPPPPNPGGPASWRGPFFAPDGVWRTPLPADWASKTHPLSDGMVEDEYTGTDFSSADIHSWAYAATEMQAKYGANGLTYMKWAGPGAQENVIYSPSSQPLTKVWIDSPSFKSSFVMVPFPSNWTGFWLPLSVGSGYFERRTVIFCENGDVWNMYGPSPPGAPTADGGPPDGDWHATIAQKVGLVTDKTIMWGGGGSGIPHGPGLITPLDCIYAQTHGDFGHCLAINTSNSADGSFAGIPKAMYPAGKGYAGAPFGPNTDGKTKTNAGIPDGARVFLDPSLSDSDLAALGVLKPWMLWFAHTFQRYGAYAKESTTGLGGAGGIMAEPVISVNWNKFQGFYPSDFVYPWFADGTMSGDHDNSTYNGAFPAALMPTSGSHWKVWDYTLATPGVNAP